MTGGAVLVCTTALFFEVVVTTVAYFFVNLSREAPDASNAGLGLVLLPVLLVLFAVVVGPLISILLVIPVVALADRLSRRTTGDEWWRVPLLASAEAAVLVAWPCQAFGTAPATTVECWLYASTALSVPALMVRLTVRRPRSPARWFLRSLAAGTAAVVRTVTTGAVAYGTGLVREYEPPRLTPATLAGVWSDGDGGTLRLAPDGTARADRLKDYPWEGTSDEAPNRCDGQGTWHFDPGEDPRSQELTLDIKGCENDEWGAWYVLGTAGRPKLYYYIGDPDSWDLYVLTKPSR
jgi:hypothetical protein